MMQDYVGKNIDRYRVIERQGVGGMAVVYHAYDTRLERDVAIKLIRTESIPQDQHERLLKRFEREGKSQAKFSHPNIVPVHDYGNMDGAPYLVMEYIPGGTLKELIGKPIDYRKVTKLLSPIADALRYAHQRKVIHRDVKPGNILINEEQRPMLTDFGIAKLLETNEMTITGTGLGVGTPEYMAPEQWKGIALPQTDIYALGVVFYELLTGVKPYRADTPAAVAILQATEPLPRPTRYVSDLPGRVEKMLFKAMARNPEDRYESMSAFQLALENLLDEPKNNYASAFFRKKSKAKLDETAPITANTTGSDNETNDALDSTPPEDIQLPEKKGSSPLSSSLPPRGEAGSGSKKLPAWLLWVGIGVVLLGLTFGLGSKLVDLGTEGSGPLAMLATETNTATVTPSQTATATQTATSTKTTTPTKTSTPSKTPKPTLGIGSSMIREKDSMEMVYVPAGEFMMGSEEGDSDESPVHEIYLDAYWIDKYEVTNGQYEDCVAAGECSKPHSAESWTRDSYYGNENFQNYPVLYVDWYQAQAYCEWAGGRLPTEAEWEKAARGTDERMYPWGNESPTCSLANYGGTSGCVGDTNEVGSYPSGASPYGALDMAGNVWEWVPDWYDEDYYSNSPAENPGGPASGDYRVLRGGSWNLYEYFVRSAARYRYYPDLSWYSFGFRCSLSPESQP